MKQKQTIYSYKEFKEASIEFKPNKEDLLRTTIWASSIVLGVTLLNISNPLFASALHPLLFIGGVGLILSTTVFTSGPQGLAKAINTLTKGQFTWQLYKLNKGIV